MKSLHQQTVERFLIGAGHTLPSKPTQPTAAQRELQARCLMEETLEAIEALGVEVQSSDGLPCDSIVYLSFWPRGDFTVDLGHLAKEYADVDINAIATLSFCGIHDSPVLNEVDSNNLGKLARGSKRADGKWLRPENYPKPAMDRVLLQQDLDPEVLFEVTYDSALRNLFQERYAEIHPDDIWLAGKHAFHAGLTPDEAATHFFKQVLEDDLKLKTMT